MKFSLLKKKHVGLPSKCTVRHTGRRPLLSQPKQHARRKFVTNFRGGNAFNSIKRYYDASQGIEEVA